jgi:hypothetical protein
MSSINLDESQKLNTNFLKITFIFINLFWSKKEYCRESQAVWIKENMLGKELLI